MRNRIMLPVLMLSVVNASTAFAGYGKDSSDSELLMVIISIAVCFIIFLVLREFMCWYWKINRTLSTLEEIATTNTRMMEHLQQLVKNTSNNASNTPEQQNEYF